MFDFRLGLDDERRAGGVEIALAKVGIDVYYGGGTIFLVRLLEGDNLHAADTR